MAELAAGLQRKAVGVSSRPSPDKEEVPGSSPGSPTSEGPATAWLSACREPPVLSSRPPLEAFWKRMYRSCASRHVAPERVVTIGDTRRAYSRSPTASRASA